MSKYSRNGTDFADMPDVVRIAALCASDALKKPVDRVLRELAAYFTPTKTARGYKEIAVILNRNEETVRKWTKKDAELQAIVKKDSKGRVYANVEALLEYGRERGLV